MRREALVLFWIGVIVAACFGPDLLGQAQTRLSAPLRAGASASGGERLLPFVAGAKSCADPVFVDTGAFAAAEEGAYWTPSGPQFVAVINNYRKLAGSLSPCTDSSVRLIVNDGAVYPLEHPSPPGTYNTWPEEAMGGKWVFAVKPGENPSAIEVVRPAGYTEPKLPDYYAPPLWPRPGMGVRISLGGLPSLNDLGNFPENSQSVRLGQLEIRVTAVGLAHGDWDGSRFLSAGHGHYAVDISMAIKNVSEYPNCTTLSSYSSRLFDNRRFEYHAWDFSSFPDRIGRLLPDETIGANIVFNIWYGTAPRVFTISRNVSWERDCAEKQHRPVDMHCGSEVRIPITGVPAVSPPAQ